MVTSTAERNSTSNHSKWSSFFFFFGSTSVMSHKRVIIYFSKKEFYRYESNNVTQSRRVFFSIYSLSRDHTNLVTLTIWVHVSFALFMEVIEHVFVLCNLRFFWIPAGCSKLPRCWKETLWVLQLTSGVLVYWHTSCEWWPRFTYVIENTQVFWGCCFFVL